MGQLEPWNMTQILLSELAEVCGADLEGDGGQQITGPASLLEAGPGQISFLAHPSYRSQLEHTGAAAVLLGRDIEVERSDLAVLRSDNPGQAFTRVILAFSPEDPLPEPGVHPTAVVDPAAHLAEDVHVGPGCVIGPGATVEAGAILDAQVVVGSHCRVGRGTRLYPRVVLYPRVELGERCVIHSGTVVGADGFGFEYTPSGWEKTPQCGNVVVEDDVEIGAGCTIDCARFGSTRIGRGTKLDNLVHIAHNVQVGQSCVIVAQVGIAGSTRVGNGVMIGGKGGLTGHIEVGDGARIGAASVVLKDVPAGEEHVGYPAGPKPEMVRSWHQLKKLGDLQKRIRGLEQQLAELEGAR